MKEDIATPFLHNEDFSGCHRVQFQSWDYFKLSHTGRENPTIINGVQSETGFTWRFFCMLTNGFEMSHTHDALNFLSTICGLVWCSAFKSFVHLSLYINKFYLQCGTEPLNISSGRNSLVSAQMCTFNLKIV